MEKDGSKGGGKPRAVNKSADTGCFVSSKAAKSPKTTYEQTTTQPCK